MIEHEIIHPVDEGWQAEIIADPKFKYRVLFAIETNPLLNNFRNIIRHDHLTKFGYTEDVDMIMYKDDSGVESDEVYLTDIGILIKMKLDGDEQTQTMLSRIIKIEERE